MIFHAKEYMTSLFFGFCLKLGCALSDFLGYSSFVNTMEGSSLDQLIEFKKAFLPSRNP